MSGSSAAELTSLLSGAGETRNSATTALSAHACEGEIIAIPEIAAITRSRPQTPKSFKTCIPRCDKNALTVSPRCHEIVIFATSGKHVLASSGPYWRCI
jgi:hypothetical protein